MSYLVLARKWRPQVFADLIGQEHVSRTLANSIRSGRIHHAFLFTGARGVGKTSAARILARALNCEQGDSTEPCNVCQSCLEVTAGKSVDVIEIDGASNNGVDDMCDLRETLRYLPAQSRYKIYIIDEVHMLSINAFNALLKTLEEPPPHVKFIFATTEPHKIPITILSRCQRFDFRKIPAVKVVAHLRRIVDAEKITISERSLALIVQRGGGSMRDCLSTLDQIVAFCSENVADADVQSVLGVVDKRLLFDVLEACMQQNCSMVLQTVRRIDDLGHSFRQFSQELIEMVRKIILCSVVDNPQDELGLFGDEFQSLSHLMHLAAQDDWQRLLSLLIKTETELAGSVYPKLLVEMTLVRAASLPPSCDIVSLIHTIEALEQGFPTPQLPQRTIALPSLVVPATRAADPVIPQDATVSASCEAAPVVIEKLAGYVGESAVEINSPCVVELGAAIMNDSAAVDSPSENDKGWTEFVQYVTKERPRIGSLLEHGSLLDFTLPVLRVGFERGSFLLQQLCDSETSERLNVVAQQFFGQQVQVKVEALSVVDKAPPSLIAVAEQRESDRGRRLREDALSHPMVKKALEVFSGEIENITAIDKGFV